MHDVDFIHIFALTFVQIKSFSLVQSKKKKNQISGQAHVTHKFFQ